ncbi:HD domain-containing protein [Candidatus Nomurabacteria bacterium]|nr:HD domain-containing protein [Candidatus Nomurabacteria bacterium]
MKSYSKTTQEDLFWQAAAVLGRENDQRLHSAAEYATKHHAGQNRKSGEPYIVHPFGVAASVLQKYHDVDLAMAALLHDTVEDCPNVCMEEIYHTFGDEVGFLVDAVTKQRKSFFGKPEIQIEDRVERLLWAGVRDVRVLLLKLADRENNLSTIEHLKKNKQIRMAFETQAVYIPLRKILSYESDPNLVDAARDLASYMHERGLTTPAELKQHLMNESFDNFDNDMFGLVYNDTKSIVWKITDLETYRKICNTDSLSGLIRFLSVAGNKHWFEASFYFLRGGVIDEDIRLGISSFQG